MENASEALIMAFAVLIFVLALSISISSFTQARVTSEAIMQMSDSSFDYTYVGQDVWTPNKDGEEVNATKRTVGSETIIPTLYRAYKENLVIIFQDSINATTFNNGGIFAQKLANDTETLKAGQWNNDNGITLDNNKIDLQALNLGSEARAIEFVNCLLYGTKNDNKLLTEYNAGGSKLYRNLCDESLYNIITKNTFKEFIGAYYMDDEISSEETQSSIDTGTSSRPSVSDVNKTKRRVITYVLQ